MSKLIMGYWDCPFCNAKHIEGLERDCPNCGRARSKETEFYIDENNIEYLTEEEAKTKGKGADWLCSYCDSLNSVLDDTCKGCGAQKSESQKDYFQMHEESQVENTANETPKSVQKEKPKRRRDPSKARWYHWLLALIIYGLPLFLFISFLLPKHVIITVEKTAWEYNISIEKYGVVEESDWTLPDKAKLIKKKKEIHHYDKELDHYETKTETHEERVLDGYDVSYNRVNNGDGTFSEERVETPRYRTETRTETVEVPVYKDVPVYRTKYYYEIKKWHHHRYVTSSGENEEPYWGEVSLQKNERQGAKTESYKVSGLVDERIEHYTCKKEIWNQFEIGKDYKIKVSDNEIIAIK